jgi:hypothetical protein
VTPSYSKPLRPPSQRFDASKPVPITTCIIRSRL